MTNTGWKVVNLNRVGKVLIDSTYNTNKQKLELFEVMGFCFGIGFPIIYFIGGCYNGIKMSHK